ncbi:MAG: redox-regulated ATPase YchF [Caldimicrobium sp.]|nr:redox-regulated ATPase YchF [Caldimicrobium sp.]MCX7613158.1 redox-regulated ATPase YchF [Caldimicrobium sp.]MDW8183235.1 redox-regulated ATPase YchF [Caldimicrobium sp.]
MDLNIGLVGLPNVGKSTIFNALLQKIKAEVANYPFCTIEPNVGMVAIPDERLDFITKRERSAKTTPALIEFVDIAGLVKGASKGAGLGNQFLSHIRGVSAIAQVLRCFWNNDIVHVEGEINPIRDAEIIEIELIMADLQTLERREERVQKQAKADKSYMLELDTIRKSKEILEELKPLRLYKDSFSSEEWRYLEKTLFLLSIKPMMYIANLGEEDLISLDENEPYRALEEKTKNEGIPLVALCGKLENELANLTHEEKKAFLEAFGLKEPGLNVMIREGFKLLKLINFYTTGPKETRAWIIKEGTTAKEAAGEIHSDMERGFIAAEVLPYEDYLRAESWQKARDLGLIRLEGKDYLVKDGDIIYFRFNV